MSNKKILLAISCFFALLGAGFFCFFLLAKTPTAKADSDDDNISEWAWSETIGWVSFNSANCDSNDNGKSDGSAGCPAAGTPMASYGVNIAQDGLFSGYAWSESVGWIDFAPAGPYPAAPNYFVKVNLDTGQVSGWARALAYGGGWDGWIRLDGVSINTETGVFSGYAWGSDVVGWLSFSGPNYQTKTAFDFNSAPNVGNLSVIPGDYCSSPLQPILNWVFSDSDGDSQDGYQAQVDDDSNVADNPILDSCQPSPGTCSAGHSSSSYAPSPFMSFVYNSIYYWRVKVADNRGAWSAWSEVVSFTTPNHAFPEPDFSTVPQKISKNEFVQFCAAQEEGICEEDNSVCYDADGVIPPPSCHNKTFLWDFPEGAEFAEGSNENSENPKVKFSSSGQQEVSLTITDQTIPGACAKTETKTITKPLPKWKEIAP